MASSIAAITMERSIDFSRATALAICSSSSLLALTAMAQSPSVGSNSPRRNRSAARRCSLVLVGALLVLGAPLDFNFGFGLLLLDGSLFFACGGGGGSSP